ncbi:MAG: lipopolysaccharide kinase InaA family protein, partial [Thermoanaerobaculia bacterium]|nr:lipopolysaccharide kinase InaA family protein [Thermoanaerobaculia bacterium]
MRTKPFVTSGFWGEWNARLGVADLESVVERISDPASAIETVHWGRNYLYSVEIETAAGAERAVVKLFRNQGWRRRLERRVRGSKAAWSWRMAWALREAGVATPEPFFLVESERPDGPSLYVSRQLDGFVEARYVFRALARGALETEFPQLRAEAFVEAIAGAARRLHDAGFWHRDLSIGNLLLTPDDPAWTSLTVHLIDLNRMRRRRRVSLLARTRDLCRLGFVQSELEQQYLDHYWNGSAGFYRRLLYRVCRALYLLRVEGKKSLRSTARRVGQAIFLRKPYTHIPPPPEGAGRRDKAVWDRLSDQPHQHAGRLDRWSARLGDFGSHLRAFSAAMATTPRVRRRYRRLERSRWSEPVAWPGVGVAIGPGSVPTAELVAAVEALGTGQVLIRLHPWEESWEAQAELARELSEREIDLVFALPQIRELVRDPDRWRRAVAAIGRRFSPYGRRFQIGQAINRSKWGLWSYGEYLELLRVAAQELRAVGDVELLGPAVIDFEPHALAAALNYPRARQAETVRLDVVSCLLYVDRRGAPENTQLGFDTLGKATLMRAIGETARLGAPRFWITEVNWPLWEGPHSPAGRAVSVDEERQADYLVRYCVPLLASGLAERIYWWQLAARGYGLLDPRQEGLRRRPSFD